MFCALAEASLNVLKGDKGRTGGPLSHNTEQDNSPSSPLVLPPFKIRCHFPVRRRRPTTQKQPVDEGGMSSERQTASDLTTTPLLPRLPLRRVQRLH